MIDSRLLVAAAFLVSAAAGCHAADRGASESARLAAEAMAKGYGATCSLENIPVKKGGYYPCIDIPPYRFVKSYGKIEGFVLTDGQPPFAVMRADESGANFLYVGPWTDHMAGHVAAWWDDEIGGGKVRREAEQASDKRRQDAEKAVRGYMDPPKTESPKAETETPSPAAGAPERPAPKTQASPAMQIPPGGVLIAPGVVRYPAGPSATPLAPR